MRWTRWVKTTLACGIAVGAVVPAAATSFGRLELDRLVADNETIVVGEVVAATSRWNEPRTLILTDVRVAVAEVLKGAVEEREINLVLPGGRVGERANVVVGGADLKPGGAYLLFLRHGDLPGAPGVRIVGDHSQGVFEIEPTKDGARAVSQALRRGLVTPAAGRADSLGGVEGLPFDTLRRTVERIRERGADGGGHQEAN